MYTSIISMAINHLRLFFKSIQENHKINDKVDKLDSAVEYQRFRELSLFD